MSHGYASLEPSDAGYDLADVVKVEVAVNYPSFDALAFIGHCEEAQELTGKLKYPVPLSFYPILVQAVVEGKVIARVEVPPRRKNAAVLGEKRVFLKKQALLRCQSINQH